jgi:GDP-6-deoxy-D-talose 4-dehydrogenase
MRVLITGANGFTGRHLSARLAGYGAVVFGLGFGQATSVSVAESLDADIHDKSALVNWLRHTRPTHIVHLAALSHTVGEPLPFYDINVLGTESLLEAIKLSSIEPPRVIVASSASVYGNPGKIRASENQPLLPLSHYGVSKAAMEMVVAKWFGYMPILVVRPFNYTGEGQSEGFVYAKIIGAHRRKEKRLILGNLNVSRDLSDVNYVCEAYLGLLLSDAHSHAVNICSGRATTLQNVLDVMADISGYRPKVEIDPALIRQDDINYLCGDTALLNACAAGLQTTSLRVLLERMYLASC